MLIYEGCDSQPFLKEVSGLIGERVEKAC